MYEEQDVTRSQEDDLVRRLSVADPASELAPLSDGALSRVVRHAMTPTPRPWSRRRFRLATLGALAGSGGLVLAGVLGLETASPGLPVFALGRLPQPSVENRYTAATPSVAEPSANFSFQSAPGLPTSTKALTVYRLSSPIGAASAAAELAAAFRVDGPVEALRSGGFRVRGSGAAITTWRSAGVVEWSYKNTTGLD